jgi:hypothetical protein
MRWNSMCRPVCKMRTALISSSQRWVRCQPTSTVSILLRSHSSRRNCNVRSQIRRKWRQPSTRQHSSFSFVGVYDPEIVAAHLMGDLGQGQAQEFVTSRMIAGHLVKPCHPVHCHECLTDPVVRDAV